MDNDIFIPYKFRASQIVGITKVAVKFIEANGIQLKEVLNTIPTEKKLNRITWLNVAQAKIRGEILGTTIIGELRHVLELWVNGNWGPAGLEIQSVDTEPEGNVNQAFVRATVVDRVTKEGNTVTLIDSERRSSFPQLGKLSNAGVQRKTLYWGAANAGGGVNPTVTCPGVSVTRTAVGVYTIKFEQAAWGAELPIVMVIDVQGTQRTASTAVLNNKEVQVTMSNGTGAKEDITWSFIAIV